MVLINRNFALLWFGQLISQLGDKAYNIALMWWVLEKTGSPFMVSSFLVATMLPELLLGPLAGVYIDRWSKKVILVLSDWIRGLAILMLAMLYWANMLEIWHVYLAALCISLCSALFNPTTMAVIPNIVDKDQLHRANALSQTIAGGVAIIGPLFGASTVAMMGYMGVLVFNGVSYLISGFAEALLVLRPVSEQKQQAVIASLLEGLRFIRSDGRVLTVVLVIAVVHVLFGGVAVISPFIANSLSGNGISNLGLMQSAIGAGMIMGAMVVTRYIGGNIRESYLFYAILCMGMGTAGLGVLQAQGVGRVETYGAACLVIGLSVAVASVVWRTITQLCVPEALSGRVFSVLSTTGNISLPLSMGAFGLLMGYTAPWILLTMEGVLLVLLGIVLIIRNQKVFAKSLGN